MPLGDSHLLHTSSVQPGSAVAYKLWHVTGREADSTGQEGTGRRRPEHKAASLTWNSGLRPLHTTLIFRAFFTFHSWEEAETNTEDPNSTRPEVSTRTLMDRPQLPTAPLLRFTDHRPPSRVPHMATTPPLSASKLALSLAVLL